jgi:hypothetical protein
LLGESGRRRDVDDERHLALLADLGHGQRGGRIKSADDAVHAVIDDSLTLIARNIRVGFEIDVDEIDPVAVVGEHLWGDEGAAVATLAGRRQVAGARQEDRDLEGLCLGADNRGGKGQRTRSRCTGQHATSRRSGFRLMCHRHVSIRISAD